MHMKEMVRVRCFRDSACDCIELANSAVSLYARSISESRLLSGCLIQEINHFIDKPLVCN